MTNTPGCTAPVNGHHSAAARTLCPACGPTRSHTYRALSMPTTARSPGDAPGGRHDWSASPASRLEDLFSNWIFYRDDEACEEGAEARFIGTAPDGLVINVDISANINLSSEWDGREPGEGDEYSMDVVASATVYSDRSDASVTFLSDGGSGEYFDSPDMARVQRAALNALPANDGMDVLDREYSDIVEQAVEHVIALRLGRVGIHPDNRSAIDLIGHDVLRGQLQPTDMEVDMVLRVHRNP